MVLARRGREKTTVSNILRSARSNAGAVDDIIILLFLFLLLYDNNSVRHQRPSRPIDTFYDRKPLGRSRGQSLLIEPSATPITA